MKYRAERLLRDGLSGHTDFSGKRCAETALNMLLEGLAAAGIPIIEGSLQWHRSLDIDRTCAALAINSPNPPLHVFGQLLDILPDEHATAIQGMRPKVAATSVEKQAAYEKQNLYLQNHLMECFRSGANQRSCLRPDHMGQRCALKADGMGTRLSLVVAGSMCTPWTSAGKREGLSSKHTESFNIWVNEVKANRYAIITLENSPHFPVEIFQQHLGEEYQVVVGCFGPENLGWPCRRRRKLITAVRKDILVWTGPCSDTECMQLFAQLFYKEADCSGDIFVKDQDPDKEIVVRRRLAAIRGLHLSDLELKAMDVKNLLTPFQRKDFDKYAALFKEADEREPGTACVVDLSQSFERKRVGTFVPTLMKNTQLYSFSQDQFFTPAAVEASQGHPTWFSTDCSRYAGCIATDTSQVSDPQRWLLSGNGQHLAAIAAWHLFIFCHLVVRDVSAVGRPLSTESTATALKLQDPGGSVCGWTATPLKVSSSSSENKGAAGVGLLTWAAWASTMEPRLGTSRTRS